MKLVLFTPAASTSAIGLVCAFAARALVEQGHDVTLVRSEDLPLLSSPTHDYPVSVARWNDTKLVRRLLADADAVAYHVGDNYQFHRGCLEWLPRHPAVVCLHDYFLCHLFWSWAERDRPRARAILRAFYGSDIAERFFTTRNSADLIGSFHDVAPLTEWVASMATGVLTHSTWGIDRVLAACAGPVHVVGLAYPARRAPAARPTGARRGGATPAVDEFVVVTVGHNNPNKRSESVIKALGASPILRDRATYRLVGPIDRPRAEHLATLARRLGVKLTISGSVDDAALGEALDRADVVCCLRYPALEAASASAIEAMLGAKATVVTDAGFYSELPDGCVCKVSPEREVQDLQRVLESLYLNPAQRVEFGRRAADYAARTFSAENYVARLVELCRLAAKAGPPLEASRFFADVLVGWGASSAQVAPSGVAPLIGGLWPSSSPWPAAAPVDVPAAAVTSARAASTN